MAVDSGAITGWGVYIGNYLNSSLTVVNDAVAGTSARSFTRGGNFASLINSVKSGDFVIIEFGHNDGGGLACSANDNGDSDDEPGSVGYSATCTTTWNGATEIVRTYEAYLSSAATSMVAKGAHVIISSPTVNNPWETGTFSYTPSRFATFASDAATASGSTYVNHEASVAAMWKALGAQATDADFPQDHTHTSPAGANLVAQSFITALQQTNAPLKAYIKGSSSTTTTKGTTTTTTKPSGACQAIYGQCGGIGYSGPTCCSSGTCTVSNAYYSQCI